MSFLLTAQYLDYAAVVACLLIDYGIWGRRRQAIRGKDWLILLLPQLVTAAVVCPIWNPIERAASVVGVSTPASHQIAASSSHAWLHGFVTLIWWNFRDLIACDFVILPLLMLCPILYLKSRNAALLRAPLAFLVFICAISFFTAHPLPAVGNAEVRYLAPLLPLCIGISILTVWRMVLQTPVLRYAEEPGFIVEETRLFGVPQNRRLPPDRSRIQPLRHQLLPRALAPGDRTLHTRSKVGRSKCPRRFNDICLPRYVCLAANVGPHPKPTTSGN